MFKDRKMKGKMNLNLVLLKLTPLEFNSLVTKTENFKQKNIQEKYFGSGRAIRQLANHRGVDKGCESDRLQPYSESLTSPGQFGVSRGKLEKR